MRLLTYQELNAYSLAELHYAMRRLLLVFPTLPEGSRAREIACLNIQHVRMFIARHGRRMAFGM
jgi:hypothetical protein